MKQVPPRRSFPVAAAAAAVGILMLGGCGGDEPSAPVTPPAPRFAASGAAVCGEEAYAARDPGGGWRHPQQNFYAPGDEAPSEADLQHLIVNDASVVVRYHPSAPASARSALRAWAARTVSVVVAPARSRSAPQVVALTINRRLTCDGVDPAQLDEFARRRGSLSVEPHDGTG